ncbi:MAG: TRAP transporter substrate-binding protein DctP [Pseudomonadales bacterium]
MTISDRLPKAAFRTGWILLLLGCLLGGQAQAVTFKVATLSPDGSGWMKMLREGAAEVAERTDGRVTFKFYPGGVMGDDKAVLRKIRSGQLHGAVITAGGLSQVYSDIQLYTLPMVFDNLAEVDYVRSRMDPMLMGGLRERGFVGFGIAEVGFAYAMSKDHVETFEEIRAQKVWIPDGDPGAEMAIRTFDITPIPLSIADVLGGLQTGLIDSVAVPPVGAIALQWHTQLRYVFDLPLLYVYGLLTVRDRQFDALDAGDQAIVSEVMGEVVKRVNAQNRIDHERAVEVLKTQGLTFTVPTPAEAERWKGLAEQASEEMISQGVISGALHEELESELAAFRGGLD